MIGADEDWYSTTSGDVDESAFSEPDQVTFARQRFHSSYQRHPKPPYPYCGMIIHAINTAPEKCMTLSNIKNKLGEMFEFFRGPYRGWKDSVRHNLSHNACFVKGDRATGLDSKGNLWYVDISKAPINAFKIQDTNVARNGIWATDLHVQLGVPEIHIPAKSKSNYSVFASSSPDSDDIRSSTPYSTSTRSSTPSTDNVLDKSALDESIHESRENPAFLSDTSFEDRESKAGPIKPRKRLRANRKQNSLLTKMNREKLMNAICKNVSQHRQIQQQAVQNLSVLCHPMELPPYPYYYHQYSAHVPQAQYPWEPAYYQRSMHPNMYYPTPYPGYVYNSPNSFDQMDLNQPTMFQFEPNHHGQSWPWYQPIDLSISFQDSEQSSIPSHPGSLDSPNVLNQQSTPSVNEDNENTQTHSDFLICVTEPVSSPDTECEDESALISHELPDDAYTFIGVLPNVTGSNQPLADVPTTNDPSNDVPTLHNPPSDVTVTTSSADDRQ